MNTHKHQCLSLRAPLRREAIHIASHPQPLGLLRHKPAPAQAGVPRNDDSRESVVKQSNCYEASKIKYLQGRIKNSRNELLSSLSSIIHYSSFAYDTSPAPTPRIFRNKLNEVKK